MALGSVSLKWYAQRKVMNRLTVEVDEIEEYTLRRTQTEYLVFCFNFNFTC